MATRYDISNPGLGSQCNNTGFGTQNNNAGSGNQYNAEFINFVAQENGDAKLLADLWVTDPRHDKTRIERRKGGLLRDSYRWILDHEAFVRWQADTQSSLLWIRGDPGKGKTMLICGIIDELPARMPRWQTIYFFCEATDSRLNNATAVLRSLLYLLLRNRPSLSKFIREEHAHAGRRLFEDANGWDVLEETFTKIAQDGGLKDFILIIDALDECRTGLGQLLDVIVRLSSLNVKVIASSRNWLSIEETILDVSDQVCISLELNEKSISAAVNRYICHKVDQLASRKKYDISTRNYIYDHLSSKADDTFLWVALVTDQLGKPGVSERHARIKVEEFPRKLNSLYERMLERTWESNDRDRCKRILAVVSIVYRPVTLLELMSLAELEEFRAKTEILEEIVGECGSLLTVKDGIVYFVHQSAKDFISGHALAEVMPFGIHHEHNLLLSRSLEVMYKTCRRNIYDLQEPRESLDDIRTPVPDPLGPARYACAYWLEHISDGGHLNEQQYSQVYDFLEQHFLHWIEALSPLKSMSGGIASLFKFARAIQASVMSEQKLFIQDALRFIRYFRVAVESWPLEVYSSALVFSPTQSIIRKKFESEIADWIIKKPVVDDEWSPCLQTLEGHELEVRFLLSAPDGIKLASASIDKTVKLWDTITGECLRTLRGHEARVESLAFSLKGEMLASVSKDAVVKLWNMATGGLLNTFHGTSRSGIILSPKLHVSFCGGDKHVALGSREIVEIWDTATGQLVRQFMCEGLHAIAATEVAFSADGALFASYKQTGQVVLFDTASGRILKMLPSQPRDGNWRGTRLAFLRDDTQLANCYENSALTLWDITTSQSIWTDVDCYFDAAVACSRDGGLIARSSTPGVDVKIRDGVTGKILQMLPIVDASALTFSLDGTHLFSTSWDRWISIWDLTRLQRHQLNEPHVLVSDLPSTATSPSSLSATKGYINNNRKAILAVAFSNNGKQLASLSRARLTIWDYTTGQCLRTTSINASILWEASLTYYGNRILFAGENPSHIFTVWDAATSLPLKQFGSMKGVSSFCFSKGGATLAVLYLYTKTIKLLDVATGDCKVTFSIGVEVYRLRFSESGSQLITQTGIINLESLSSTGAAMSTPQTLEITKSNPQGLMLSEQDRSAWVQKDSKPMLWIPPEYRQSSYYNSDSWVFDVRGSAIAIGSRSGRVLMMEFSLDTSVM